MLRASVVAILLLTAPVHAQEEPDLDDLLVEVFNADGDDDLVDMETEESGTPNDGPADDEGGYDEEVPPERTGYAVLYLPHLPIDPTNIYDPRSPVYIPPLENPDFVPPEDEIEEAPTEPLVFLPNPVDGGDE